MAKHVKPRKLNAVKMTVEKYAELLKAYLEDPTIFPSELAKKTGQSLYNATRALTGGWSTLHLPRLCEASGQWVDPERIHVEMAKIEEGHKQIEKNLFGALATKVLPESPKHESKLHALAAEEESQIAGKEANKRMGESAFASRISMSLAAKTARGAEFLAREYIQMIEKGEVELPEKVRPEHLFLLSKIADTAANAVHKALQTERLRAGQPETVVGAHISALLVGATPDELKQVVMTGLLPPRMMGLVDQPMLNPIDVEAIEVEKVRPGPTGSDGGTTSTDGEEDTKDDS